MNIFLINVWTQDTIILYYYIITHFKLHYNTNTVNNIIVGKDRSN